MYLCQVKLKKAFRVIKISLVVPSTEMESLGNIKQMGSNFKEEGHVWHYMFQQLTTLWVFITQNWLEEAREEFTRSIMTCQ